MITREEAELLKPRTDRLWRLVRGILDVKGVAFVYPLKYAAYVQDPSAAELTVTYDGTTYEITIKETQA